MGSEGSSTMRALGVVREERLAMMGIAFLPAYCVSALRQIYIVRLVGLGNGGSSATHVRLAMSKANEGVLYLVGMAKPASRRIEMIPGVTVTLFGLFPAMLVPPLISSLPSLSCLLSDRRQAASDEHSCSRPALFLPTATAESGNRGSSPNINRLSPRRHHAQASFAAII